jgi:N-acetylglucosamine kinase-like BadF-type ATPase
VGVIVGVDAGGSHTELGVAAGPGDAPHVRVRGPGIALALGAEPAARTVRDLLRQALDAPDPGPVVDALVVGAAGAGRPAPREALELALAGLASRVRVVTDMEIALADAFPAGAGVLLGAGTGSYALGLTTQGEQLRAGGWGPLLSDEGSGTHLARHALRQAVRELDGREPRSALTAALLSATGCADLDALVTWSAQAERVAVAALAREVCALAEAGVSSAVALVEQAATQLVALAEAVAVRLGVSPAPVALAGGLLSLGSPVREALVARLQEASWARPVDRPVDPLVGALRLAATPVT